MPWFPGSDEVRVADVADEQRTRDYFGPWRGFSGFNSTEELVTGSVRTPTEVVDETTSTQLPRFPPLPAMPTPHCMMENPLGGIRSPSVARTEATPKPGGTNASSPFPSYRLQLVLEENAKWGLAREVLREIREVHQQRTREDLQRRRAKRRKSTGTPGGGSVRGEEPAADKSTGKKYGGKEAPSGTPADEGGGAGAREGTEPAGGSRVLVLVRDEHTCGQLREHWALGGPRMMRKRFLA